MHDGLRRVAIGADHDPVWTHEVLDCGALAQEFGVRNDVIIGIGPGFPDDTLDIVARANRHRRFRDHDGIAVERFGNLRGCGVHKAKICVTVPSAARRAHRNENDV